MNTKLVTPDDDDSIRPLLIIFKEKCFYIK